MCGDFRKYFDRKYYRKIEKKFAIGPLIYCWWFNFVVAMAVFSLSMYMFADTILAIFHTFLGWTITLTMSIVYWLMWIQSRIKGGRNVKIVAASAIMVMFLIALLFIIRTFTFVLRAL